MKCPPFLRTRQPSEAHGQIDERRRMVAHSPSTLSVVEGCLGSIPVHFAWSRDLYQSAAVTFTVDACLRFLFGAAGSGWPARRRNHFKPLCTGHRPYRGTLKPSARLDRTGIMVPRITSTAYRVGGVRALTSPALAVRRKVGCVHLITIGLHT